MRTPRVPLDVEPIEGAATVARYDRYAALYIQPEYRYTARLIHNYGIHGGRVLDIGTGSGRLARELAGLPHSDYRITGLDISADMLKAALSDSGGSSARINYIRATAASLPFPDESFEVVTSYASLHHWLDPVRVFNEIWRVTQKNGLIVIRDNRRMIGNPLFKMGISLISIFMSRDEKKRWPKSIMASYELEEVGSILQKTVWQDYTVSPDMGGFDLRIVGRKTG